LLCGPCNIALGHYESIRTGAAKYLSDIVKNLGE
jgi:hypothetical protein